MSHHVDSWEFEANCTGLAHHLIDDHDVLVNRDEYGSFGIDAGAWSKLARMHRVAHWNDAMAAEERS